MPPHPIYRPDLRDNYVGLYKGILVYSDLQWHISDTTPSELYLIKYDNDTISKIELRAALFRFRYLYSLENDGLYYYGIISGDEAYETSICYHCPIISLSKDSLYCQWTPGLGPPTYKYIMKKAG
jgi:hypothetical protein